MKEQLLERLIRYCKINTRSDAKSKTVPSTVRQFDLAKVLVEEAKSIGLEDVYMDAKGIVTATLPSNISKEVPTIAFLAHMDTADYESENVQPKVIENYNGEDIILNEAKNIITRVEDFPNLKNHIGKTLVVTDGTTLLGADDKAGVAAIMTAMEYLIQNPEIPHGRVRIAFTIDEEIGTGAHHVDLEQLAADFAYTIDGGELGGLEFENFNAASAEINIQGISVHPGSAKNTMINSLVLAHELFEMLPAHMRPEHTEGHEGFYLLDSVEGNVEKTTMSLIIRDHDRDAFEAKKAYLKEVVEFLNKRYNGQWIELHIEDSYYNMREVIEKDMSVVNLALEAMDSLGIEAKVEPIRGGTDGATLSQKGLPCPNLFTGGENFHGPHEFVVVETMEKAALVIAEIASRNAQFKE